MIAQIAPMGRRHRISRDEVWPARCADGRTFAERKADEARGTGPSRPTPARAT